MNYYELLNIERDADANTIKRAYFSAVKIHSPDKNPKGFKAIRLAYETLSDLKKRSEYDSYFVLTGELQNKLLTAREMIRENRYKQAEEFLTGLIGTDPDSEDQLFLFSLNHQDDNDQNDNQPAMFYAEAKRLLAEVSLYMEKSDTAKKICEQLLKKNPSDAETLLLLASITVGMGNKKKADKYFNDAVTSAPLNARAWIAYLRFAMRHTRDRVPYIFKRAIKQDIDIFRDEYILYLVGARANLALGKNYLQYCDKFAEFFLIDKNYDEEVYENVMRFLLHIVDKEDCIPFLKKILPALENSRHCKEDDEETFKIIRTALIVNKLKSDKRIREVIVDMTIFFLTEDTNKDELLGMECFIVSELSDLRPSIKVLMSEYPDFFKRSEERRVGKECRSRWSPYH